MFIPKILKLTLAASCLLALSAQAAGPDYTDYARLLESYATDDGVAYAAWHGQTADVDALNDFVTQLGQSDLAELNRSEQKALYINLYNAAMLQAVLEHYPIESVTQIGLIPFRVFKQDFIPLGGEKVSLDTVEKGILLKQFFDPRIHFAVNCASESCPPLRSEPFTAQNLEAQLDEQTRLFADSDRAARVDTKGKTIAYSELFKWYANDFDGDNPAEYLNHYRIKPLPLSYETDWIDYDWSLNETR